MSFDLLAPHYGWMEWLLAGRKLQRCRTAFLGDVKRARRVLLLGEGNGRFLLEFARMNPSAAVTVVDASAAMLRQVQRRLARLAGSPPRIQWIHTDALALPLADDTFDLIVTNFFLDCFRAEQLAELVPRLASAATADAQWIVSDFRIPSRGPARWRAQSIVAAMYCFFRLVTRLPARWITPADSLIESAGFRLQQRVVTEWGLLHADRWQRI